jgi:hypothetical protein
MFFDQDILATKVKENRWVFFLITDKGRDYVAKRLNKAFVGLEVVTLPGELNALYLDEKRAMRAYRTIRRYSLCDIYVADAKWHNTTYETIELNARAMSDAFRVVQTRKAFSEHFQPRFDAALAARDKRAIALMLREFPETMFVEKSMLINSLEFVHFPELRQGEKIADWLQAA